MTRKPTHPGEMLREEFMDELGISVAQLAKMLGVSRQTVNELVHERRRLSPWPWRCNATGETVNLDRFAC